MNSKVMTLKDFAFVFDSKPEEFSESCQALIAEKDWRYEILEGESRDLVMLEVMRRMEADTQIIGAPERKDIWNNGWNENLEAFIASNFSLESLLPKYIASGGPIRLNREYVLPNHPDFHYNFYCVYRQWIFEKFLKNFDRICEFGCGPGHNLVAFSELYPEKMFVGLDFVPSAVQLVNLIGVTHKLNIHGYQFDMINPDLSDLKHIEKGSAIFTVGVIEQLAGNFSPFLDYLLQEKPGICINIEPTIELYDPNNLIDYLAIRFHQKRGYTEGFLPALQQLERNGVIEILKTRRAYTGTLMIEGHSLIVWKPLHRSSSQSIHKWVDDN